MSLVAPERNSATAWFLDRPRLGPAGCGGGGGSHASAIVQGGGDATEHGDDIGDGVNKGSEITCVHEDEDADDRREAAEERGPDADDVVMVEHRPCRTTEKASVLDEAEAEAEDVDGPPALSSTSSSHMAYSHPCVPSTSSPKATAELLASERCVVCAHEERRSGSGSVSFGSSIRRRPRVHGHPNTATTMMFRPWRLESVNTETE
jgi:hypothetical protein